MLGLNLITGIKALFSCRCTNISYEDHQTGKKTQAEISSIFFMTICVGNPTPFGTLGYLSVGKIYGKYAEG